MEFKGNFVMTANHEVNIGDTVCYYESMPTAICDCEVLELWNNPEEYGFKLKVKKAITNNVKEGQVFTISAAQGNFAYGGMWRLYNEGEYR